MKIFTKKFGGKFLKKRRGETLIEVIMALFVVALGSAAATSLIVTAIQSNSFSRDNLVALNLAVEGIEAMRNIRDTNWLKFGFDKETCWNLDPAQVVCDATTVPTRLIEDNSTTSGYTVDLNPTTFQWTMTKIGSPMDLSASGDDSAYQLNYIDVTPGADTNNDADNTDDPDLYVSKSIIGALGLTSTGESKFYRSIVVTYPASCPESNKCMSVTSTVEWKVGQRVDRVQLKSTLTNYDKVKKS